MNLLIWIKAFRLRTLPLALSCSVLGSFLAYASGSFRLEIFLMAASTTLFLQILSNLANDYGDAIHGVDNKNRIGPGRVTQSGLIGKRSIKRVILLFAFLSLINGLLLIFIGLHDIRSKLFFLVLGLIAIYAAITYTIGRKPYGYVGLGDMFVFIFFGIVGVAGTYYLHTHTFTSWIFLPASAIGLLSSGVLNLNNMRDIKNDSLSGKRTLVVRLGSKGAKMYHVALICLSMVLSLIYTIKFYHSIFQFLFILTFPLFVLNIKVVIQNTEPVELNTELRKLALTTLIFSIMFGLGFIL